MQKTMQKAMQKDADTIQKTIQKDSDTIQKTIQKKLESKGIEITKLQMDILVYFAINPEATRKDYISSREGISEGGTISNISRLQEIGVLHHKGGRKKGSWVVTLLEEQESV